MPSYNSIEPVENVPAPAPRRLTELDLKEAVDGVVRDHLRPA